MQLLCQSPILTKQAAISDIRCQTFSKAYQMVGSGTPPPPGIELPNSEDEKETSRFREVSSYSESYFFFMPRHSPASVIPAQGISTPFSTQKLYFVTDLRSYTIRQEHSWPLEFSAASGVSRK